MVSLLDIIGPVMVGPSSSHTAGACRIGLLARGLVGGTPEQATVELHGSFARTGEGHGTDKAIAGGLMGFRPDDERIRDALGIAERIANSLIVGTKAHEASGNGLVGTMTFTGARERAMELDRRLLRCTPHQAARQ